VHLPPGATLGENAPGTCNTGGYHDVSSVSQTGPHGTFTCNFAFIAVVDVSTNPNGLPTGAPCDVWAQGGITANGLNFGLINASTYIVSHELIEAIVDPFASTREIGDLCQKATGTNPWSTMPSNSGPPWLIASTWSSASSTCWVSEQSVSTNANSSGYVPLPSSTIATWTWDDESYKSSGFAVARGPSHLDIFSTEGGEGGTQVLTTIWDAAAEYAGVDGANWAGLDSGWKALVLPPPAIPASPEVLTSTSGIAPLAAPVTAVSPSPTLIFAFVAGSNGQIYEASCTTGDGCRTTGTWNSFAPIEVSSGSYTIAPGTPIAVVSPSNVIADPPTLFFAGAHREIFELEDVILVGWAASQVAPAGTLPTEPNNAVGKSYVSAFSRYEVTSKSYIYEVFAAGTTGEILWYSAPAGIAPFTSSPISGSSVQPGTQIAALSRVPGQMDLFAVDTHGAVQSYWWNELVGGWFQVTNLMPAGTANAGAGIAVSGRADHMDVYTTTSSS
jgi:hypothetical protein